VCTQRYSSFNFQVLAFVCILCIVDASHE
jgi:hypothetical protein